MGRSVSTSELKTHCAAVIAEVAHGRTRVTITKRGRPVARIVPIEDEVVSLFGIAKGIVTIRGDIVSPIDVEWETSR